MLFTIYALELNMGIVQDCTQVIIFILASLSVSGLTNFDLIGNFGSMDWLGNFYIIMLCNIIFAALTILCLTTKFTATVRSEIYERLATAIQNWIYGLKSRESLSYSTNLNTTVNGGMKED